MNNLKENLLTLANEYFGKDYTGDRRNYINELLKLFEQEKLEWLKSLLSEKEEIDTIRMTQQECWEQQGVNDFIDEVLKRAGVK